MRNTTAETENYALITCAHSNTNLLIRKADEHFCMVEDMDANILTQVIDHKDVFDKIANDFIFIDPLTEKQMTYAKNN